ncbi:MAG: hypothetical protein GXO33_00275 [Epsilonproteobacteria bacterium]|nr:hypothetical protein [Campylobacterota bacterium]
MNVSSTGSMSQMQTQMRMRKMDGSGMGMRNGQGGQNGMRDVMQQLTPDQRTELQSQLQSMSETDRQSMVEQMKQVDSTTMTQDQYYQTLLSMVNPTNTTSANGGLDLYA